MTLAPGHFSFAALAALAARAVRTTATGVAAAGLLATAAAAQTWPNQVVRIVVPFSAGSQTDILGRTYADKLAGIWKREVIVENKPGLAGTAYAAKATPDGYTLLLISNGHAVIESLNTNLNFDPVKDFAGITKLAVIPGIIVVNPETGPKTFKELVALARSKPGALNYASAGLGSASSIGVELIKAQTGINLVHVPYRGLPEAHTSVMRSDALLFMTFYGAGGDLIRAGKLRPVAVTSARRIPELPDVPTVAEEGVPGFSYDAWFGLLAPAGTPRPVIAAINEAVLASSRMPDHIARFRNLGIELATSTPEEFDTLVKTDTERFSRLFGKLRN
ncbi:MAG: tripartite tricarboxylate transporter substrate binding protein [Bradyrhizobiaceae bacterium]|nr:tripartite tricarboxylate transporter substrate binding protein [Bradyrhizobiaceae bacterium]